MTLERDGHADLTDGADSLFLPRARDKAQDDSRDVTGNQNGDTKQELGVEFEFAEANEEWMLSRFGAYSPPLGGNNLIYRDDFDLVGLG